MTTTDVRTAALFNATDRCDRCPARATTRAVLRDGGELVFCDHHLGQHRDALAPLVRWFERHVELDEALAFVPALTAR